MLLSGAGGDRVRGPASRASRTPLPRRPVTGRGRSDGGRLRPPADRADTWAIGPAQLRLQLLACCWECQPAPAENPDKPAASWQHRPSGTGRCGTQLELTLPTLTATPDPQQHIAAGSPGNCLGWENSYCEASNHLCIHS